MCDTFSSVYYIHKKTITKYGHVAVGLITVTCHTVAVSQKTWWTFGENTVFKTL